LAELLLVVDFFPHTLHVDAVMQIYVNRSPVRSPVVVILAASDLTYTAVHCRRSCVSGSWKPPLEQSAARRHFSSNADFFWNRLKTYPLSPSFHSWLFSFFSSVHSAQ